jgi:hypothetical protein
VHFCFSVHHLLSRPFKYLVLQELYKYNQADFEQWPLVK